MLLVMLLVMVCLRGPEQHLNRDCDCVCVCVFVCALSTRWGVRYVRSKIHRKRKWNCKLLRDVNRNGDIYINRVHVVVFRLLMPTKPPMGNVKSFLLRSIAAKCNSNSIPSDSPSCNSIYYFELWRNVFRFRHFKMSFVLIRSVCEYHSPSSSPGVRVGDVTQINSKLKLALDSKTREIN